MVFIDRKLEVGKYEYSPHTAVYNQYHHKHVNRRYLRRLKDARGRRNPRFRKNRFSKKSSKSNEIRRGEETRIYRQRVHGILFNPIFTYTF